MDAVRQKVGKRAVDGAVAGDLAHAGKGRRHDLDGEMAFAAWIVAGVADVTVAVVDDGKVRRLKLRLEAALDFVADGGQVRLFLCRGKSLYAGSTMQQKATKPKPGAFPGAHRCAEPGCDAAGDYRAPPGDGAAKAADGPPRWQYFCLDHVRQFNAKWNYFEGMSAEEIWAAQSPHAGWDEQATRVFAHNAATATLDLDDPHQIFGRPQAAARRPGRREAADRRALAALGLGEDATLAEVKAKYRALARIYHPDTNQGDRRHEARFRALTDAYRQLTESVDFRNR